MLKLMMFILAISLPANALGINPGLQFPLDIHDVYVPNGFDDNDNAQIVVDGFLPYSCDVMLEPQSQINPLTSTINIDVSVLRLSEDCHPNGAAMTVAVDLGAVPIGRYEVVVNREFVEILEVEEAQNAGPDDFLYAEIGDVYVAEETSDGWPVSLTGIHERACHVIDAVKVIDSGKTIEVLPIVSQDPSLDCQNYGDPFQFDFVIPQPRDAGRYLLHVRSRDGEALNEMLTVWE